MYNYSAIIRDAITKMRRIEFEYYGGTRVLEPHCFGVTTAGNAALRAYQISGFSVSGKVPDWHLFILAKMTNLRVLPDPFYGPRPGYRRGDRGMDYIDCQL